MASQKTTSRSPEGYLFGAKTEAEERAIHQKLTTIEVTAQDITDYFKDMGRRGGKAGKGQSKRRSKEHYRRIAKERCRAVREQRVNNK